MTAYRLAASIEEAEWVPEGQGAGEDAVDEGQDDAAVDGEPQHHRPKVPAQLRELLPDILNRET